MNAATVLRRAAPLIPLLLVAALVLSSCSDSATVDSTATNEGEEDFTGTIDPGNETFVLKRIEGESGGQPSVELIGTNLTVVAESSLVKIEVALRNIGSEALVAPVFVDLGRFVPPGVELRNPDGEHPAPMSPLPREYLRYYYEYSDYLGGDDLLEPGEASEYRTWEFMVPDLTSFSFAAAVRARGLPEVEPAITGLVYADHDRNGRFDPGTDEPFAHAFVTVHEPDGTEKTTTSDATGYYRFLLDQTGLHTLRADPGVDCPVLFTTPNPLEVLVVPDADGGPQPYGHADFGLVICPDDDEPWGPPVPIILTGEPDPADLQGDAFDLRALNLRGNTLLTAVGFSGCQPDHPLQLFVSDRFEWPIDDGGAGERVGDPAGGDDPPPELPTTWAVLQFDDLEEMCEAYWDNRVAFDLQPLRRLADERFGPEQLIRIVLILPGGETKEVVLGP
jgi:hypothetical protein